jgi:uncharacterized SAM-binding protein YcdF (DUF218 family)
MHRVGVFLAFLGSLWFGGFLIFVYGIPSIPTDLSTKTDAIVVWTGGPCRITTGVELLEQGFSDKLFVSGVGRTNPKLLSPPCRSYLSAATVDQLKEKIFFGYAALSTRGNALETAIWVKKNQVKTLRLVTTPVHMPRSLVEFQRAMPHVTVIPHPVTITKFDHRHWLTRGAIFTKVALEYSKYLLIKGGIRPWWRDHILLDEQET